VRLWDGTLWPPDEGHPSRFVVHVKSERFVREVCSRPSFMTLGRGYVQGDIEIEGDLRVAFATCDRWLHGAGGLDLPRRLLHAWSRRPDLRPSASALRTFEPRGSVDSEERAQRAVRFFYDHPTGFFASWLDPSMVYTCAYFERTDQDIAEAQERK